MSRTTCASIRTRTRFWCARSTAPSSVTLSGSIIGTANRRTRPSSRRHNHERSRSAGCFMLLATFYVAVGGAIGSVARYWLTEFAAKLWGAEFPWGTIIANVTGSLLIGAIAALPVLGPRDLLGPL